MSWTINLAYMVLLTAITGSCLLAVWYPVSLLLERAGYLELAYRVLQTLAVFFIVPVLFVFQYLGNHQGSGWVGVFLTPSPALLMAGRIFAVCWLAGVFAMAAFFLREALSLKKKHQGLFPCEEEAEACFLQVCRRLEVPEGRVRLYQSYRVRIPELSGLLKPKIVIPAGRYSQEELTVFFTHELIHYRHGDVWGKLLAACALTVQFFNPFAWWLHLLIRRFSEYACDGEVYRRTVGVKRYVEILVGASVDLKGIKRFLSSHLMEDRHEIKRRVRRMKRNARFKKYSGKLAAVLCVAMVCLSARVIFPAAEEMKNRYGEIYMDTSEETKEKPLAEEPGEHSDSGSPDGIREAYGTSEKPTLNTFNAFWRIEGKLMVRTSSFYVNSGEHITITAEIRPENVPVSVGIIGPGGARRYVDGNGSVYHRFEIDRSGTYCFFVQNNSLEPVSVEGVYIVME